MIVQYRKYNEATAKKLASEYGGYTRFGDVVWAVGDTGEDFGGDVYPVLENHEFSNNWIIVPFVPEIYHPISSHYSVLVRMGEGGWVDPESGELIKDPILFIELDNKLRDRFSLEIQAEEIGYRLEQDYVMYCRSGEVWLFSTEENRHILVE